MAEISLPRPVDQQFRILPFPPGYQVDRDQTFIYESGEAKIKLGRIYFTVPDSADDMVIFYRSEMENKGWNLINMVNYRGTTLLYHNRNQVCILTIEPDAGKTRVMIQVGPK
ncbi:MAG: hypothetical protein GWM98_16140 [Nitrospinaceae bacterium]|nr:hypothetical protein [Nitrospinaceae bacterium]NIR55734.1 hypothetical protein [Nitrospinaceae bacterium]NIS86174.1 hypothetical protein [Nitrospinaceae bacterium]NIT83013.1 hypothetical protein [Nitrospinaceae bacterium]NIU45225.1 hypothetical protein [Nitrospinaceae bacterium]